MTKAHIFTILVTLYFMNCQLSDGRDFNAKLWYDYPATDWKTQALHLGNGYMGASFYGGIKEERFDISEKTMWTGGPGENKAYNYGIIEGGHKYLEEIRNAIVDGDIEEADKLVASHFTGDYNGFGAFTSAGSLFFSFHNHDTAVNGYHRELDVGKSLAKVSYETNGVTYNREYFCSYPDRLMVLKFTSSKPGKLGFTMRHDLTQEAGDINIKGNEMIVTGKIDGNNQGYSIKIKVVNSGGEVISDNRQMTVSGADSVVVLYTVATEYRPVMPHYKGADAAGICRRLIDSASQKSYSELKERHMADYRNLYDRVHLTMAGDPELETLPTDQRWEMLRLGTTDDSGLKVLLFNLGRYLLISASRETGLPSNLQGTWNTFKQAPWSGNYQSNINLQAMYWTAGPLNLPECQEGYINWIETLVEPGRKVAREYYGTRGWVSHTTGNIWGFASPGSDMLWGMYPSASAWHCQHLWSQYEFTMDKDYLKERAWPIMKEAAEFWLLNLVPYEGKLIIAPSVSAEHGADIVDGKVTRYTITSGEARENKWFNLPGPFQDIQMVYDLFSNVIAASEVLGYDHEFRRKVTEARSNLLPMRIGKYGQLQEWAWDIDNPRNHHRHISHLYALVPGRQIDPFISPELADAAKVSLLLRGDGFFRPKWPHAGGNWSQTWRIWCWARLHDGSNAVRIFNDMVRDTGFENLMTSQSGNMQVDGSMSTPGFMAEMLLQSHQGEIHILPALPFEWPEGSVRGLVARGNFIVDIEWKHSRLVSCTIKSAGGYEIPPVRVTGELTDVSSDPRFSLLNN
jgi:alpha-L-fucosidase 2